MKVIYLLIACCLLCYPAMAGDEQTINNALKNNQTVYLNGTYNLNDQIILNEGNQLIGTPSTVLQVKSPFFTGARSIIYSESDNLLIDGIEIDGNCDQFDNSLSSSPGHAHDNEKGIMVKGSSGQFVKNVTIRNCKIHDCFGDGITAMCVDGIICEGNEIINCQHESIYYSACKNCKMLNNKMAVITSDGGRFDNCINGEAEGNIIWQYNGSKNNGAYIGGANGFQIGDAGASKGYDGRKTWITTQNVEIHNNTIADPGREGILLDETGKDPSHNVYVHDNVFKDTSELRTMGIPVDDYSTERPPTIEESEKVFSSIFDILNVKFSTTAYIPQSVSISHGEQWQKKGQYTEATLSIDGFRNISKINGVEYVPGRSQDNVIVNYQTRNIALFSGSQTSELSYQENNTTLTATLTVNTNWITKSSNSITVLGKRITVPSIKTQSETETFTTSAQVPQSFPKVEDIKAEVLYYNNSYNPHAILSLSNAWGVVAENYSYNGSQADHFKLVGEVQTKDNGVQYVNYSKISTWKATDNQISGYGNDLYIKGHFKKELLNVSVQTPYETVHVSQVNVTEIGDESNLVLNPGLWTLLGTLIIFGIWIYRNWKRAIRRW